MAQEECAHLACDCLVEEGKAIAKDDELFCSAYCAGADEEADSCECGHDDCG
ncbi:MAG TPA: metallothionein [Candidatus Eisenbacteria bacterium]|nr:metallothionein [Candidatus Eisenbacteria bacterium]